MFCARFLASSSVKNGLWNNFPKRFLNSAKTTFKSQSFSTNKLSLVKLAAGFSGAAVSIYLITPRSTVNAKSIIKDDLVIQEISDQDYKKAKREALSILIWKHSLYLVLAVVGALFVAFYNIQIPLQLGDLVNILSHMAREGVTEHCDSLKQTGRALFITYLKQAVATVVSISSVTIFGEKIAIDLRTKLMKHLVYVDTEFFDKNKVGMVVERLSSDVQQLKSSLKKLISGGLKSGTQGIGSFITMYYISAKLATITMLSVPALVLAGAVMAKLLKNISLLAQSQLAKSSWLATESLSNMLTLKAMCVEEEHFERYKDEAAKHGRTSINLGLGISVFQGLSNLSMNLMVMCVLFKGGLEIESGDVSPGSLMGFLMATQNVRKSLGLFTEMVGHYVKVSSSFNELVRILAIPSKLGNGSVREGGDWLAGTITLDNVGFAYPSRPDSPVLTNASLAIPAGSVVAVVGESGAGKSSLGLLLLRIYDPNHGVVSLDGVSLKDFDKHFLRSHCVAYVPQDPALFVGTIRDNIISGRTNLSDEQISRACDMAGASAFIAALPEGFNTQVGARGDALSGGQRQRVALARAFVDPTVKVIVLDEATSALDVENERIVMETLLGERRKSADLALPRQTVVMVTHRLDSARRADRVIVMSKGRVVETGSHAQLSALPNGFYARMLDHRSDDDFRAKF